MEMKNRSNNLPSASKLRILSFNPNSIGKNPKRANIIQAIRKKQANIILFSDTRISADIEPTIRAEWGGKSILPALHLKLEVWQFFSLKN